MRNYFKNRKLGFFLGLSGAALGFIVVVLYAVYSIVVQTVSVPVLLALLGAVACGVLSVFFEFSFLPTFMAILYGLTFGLYLNAKASLFAFYFTDTWSISGSNELIGVIGVVLAMLLICLLLSVISCFLPRTKQTRENTADPKPYA